MKKLFSGKNPLLIVISVFIILVGIAGISIGGAENIALGLIFVIIGILIFRWRPKSKKDQEASQESDKSEHMPVFDCTEIPDVPLPVVHSNLILSADEVCHYCGSATFVKSKNVVTGYAGGSQGVTVRVAKGVSYKVGAQKAVPVRGNVLEKTQGTLSITNKRIVYSGSVGAFDRKLSTLSSFTPLDDGVAFQFGTKLYPLETSDAKQIYRIISRLTQPSE